LNWKLIIKNPAKQPKTGIYTDWKEQIAEECFYQCIYCSINESQFGGIDHYHIEHYKPKSIKRFKSLENDILNLFYACPICNRFKSDDWPNDATSLDICCYPDPSVYNYTTLFTLDLKTYKLSGNHISSNYITERLFLNRAQLIYERREQILNERALAVRKELENLSKQEAILADRQSIINLLDAFSKLGDVTEKRKTVRPYKLKEIRR
jgi:hypothetical protein